MDKNLGEGQEPKSTDATLDHELFLQAVDSFKLHLGADNFYEKSDMFRSAKSKKEPVMGACPAGVERSNDFNSSLPLIGIEVPNISIDEGRGPESPLNRNENKGIALSQLLELLTDDELTISEKGIKSKFLDKPVKHFALISQAENFKLLNGIGRSLNRLKKKYGAKVPITVDVVVEYSVRNFHEETKKFIQNYQNT